jgi:hypothetical protein
MSLNICALIVIPLIDFTIGLSVVYSVAHISALHYLHDWFVIANDCFLLYLLGSVVTLICAFNLLAGILVCCSYSTLKFNFF